jgi:hypothetical protein
VVKPALKPEIMKLKVSPFSVVVKIGIAGGVLFPITKGMGPEAKVIGLPSVKYVAKVPPIVEPNATWAVPGAKVRVRGAVEVKESLPVAEKNPVMESARATATLPIAKAERTMTRLSIYGLRRAGIVLRKLSFLSRCPVEPLRLACRKQINPCFCDTKTQIHATIRCDFSQKRKYPGALIQTLCFICDSVLFAAFL